MLFCAHGEPDRVAPGNRRRPMCGLIANNQRNHGTTPMARIRRADCTGR